eukprot:Gb_15137 [translate_table: standard]
MSLSYTRKYMEGFDIPKMDVAPNKSQAKDKIARITKIEDHAKEDIVECNRHEVEPENGLKTSQECIEPHDSKSIDMQLDNKRYEDQPLIQKVKSKNEQNMQATMINIQKKKTTNLTTKQEVKYKNKPKKDMPLEKFADTQLVSVIDTRRTAHPKIEKNYLHKHSNNTCKTTPFQPQRMKFHQGNPPSSSQGSEIEWKIPWSQDIRFDQMVTAYKDDVNGAFKFNRDEYNTPLPNLYDVLLNAPGLSARFVWPDPSVHPSDYYDILLLTRGSVFFSRFEDDTFQGGMACNVPNSRVNRGK